MSCSICLEDFSTYDDIKTLDICKHKYHTECINQWFSRNVTCPLCRNITTKAFFGSYIKYPIFPIYTKQCYLSLNNDTIEILFENPITMELNKIKRIIMYNNIITFVYNISETHEQLKNYSIKFKNNISDIYNHIIGILNQSNY